MLENFRIFGRYNGWANKRLYMAASKLSDEDYRRDCGLFFKSMHGTLNHILLGDLIWMGRFEGVDVAPTQLKAILHETFENLLAARRDMDDRIINWTEELTDKQFAADFTYQPITEPDEVTAPLFLCISHLFNHQTHHRGQAHAILTRLTGDAPPLDLIYYYLENKE